MGSASEGSARQTTGVYKCDWGWSCCEGVSPRGCQRDHENFEEEVKQAAISQRGSIYGIRAMVAWPPHMEIPEPDYTISVKSFSWAMIPVLNLEDADAPLRP
jgi:hypothetical protein